MKPTTLVVAFALTLVSAYTLYAQQSSQPDLSGTWTLNLQKSKLPKKTRPTTETLVITSSGTTITARYTIDSRQSSETYVPDGKEKVVREFQGGKLFSRAKWRGPVLITETYGRIFNGSEVIHSTEHWKLSSDGHQLLIETADPKQVSVFDKAPN